LLNVTVPLIKARTHANTTHLRVVAKVVLAIILRDLRISI
jgi:hypothetical protein